jgi:hypothetical protein
MNNIKECKLCDLFHFIIINIPYLYKSNIINSNNTKFISFIIKNVINYIKQNSYNHNFYKSYIFNSNNTTNIVKFLIIFLNYKKLYMITNKKEYHNLIEDYNDIIEHEFYEIIDDKYLHIYQYISYKIYKYIDLNKLNLLETCYYYLNNLIKYYDIRCISRTKFFNFDTYITIFLKYDINQFTSLHKYKTKDFGKLRKLFILLVIYKYL